MNGTEYLKDLSMGGLISTAVNAVETVADLAGSLVQKSGGNIIGLLKQIDSIGTNINNPSPNPPHLRMLVLNSEPNQQDVSDALTKTLAKAKVKAATVLYNNLIGEGNITTMDSVMTNSESGYVDKYYKNADPTHIKEQIAVDFKNWRITTNSTFIDQIVKTIQIQVDSTGGAVGSSSGKIKLDSVEFIEFAVAWGPITSQSGDVGLIYAFSAQQTGGWNSLLAKKDSSNSARYRPKFISI